MINSAVFRSITVFFWVVCSSNLFAQTDKPKSLDSILAEDCWFNGVYSQEKTIQGLPTLLKSSGKFLFDCERGVIWLQTEPALAGFVFAKNDADYQVLTSGELEAIDSRYQTIIGRIMLMLFASQGDQIDQLFKVEVANLKPLTFELTPKNRRLKKAIRSLFIVQLPTTKDGRKQLEMTLLDSANQTLRIVNTEQNNYISSPRLMAGCAQWLGEVANISCAHLADLQPLD